MNYTWKLLSLKKTDTSDLNNVVVQTIWQKIGTDDNGNTGTFLGSSEFNLNTIDPDNFVSYEDLTEEIIFEWIQSTFSDAFEEHMEKIISDEIKSKLFPVVQITNGFPWDPEPVGIATTEPVGVATTS